MNEDNLPQLQNTAITILSINPIYRTIFVYECHHRFARSIYLSLCRSPSLGLLNVNISYVRVDYSELDIPSVGHVKKEPRPSNEIN